jgi:putative transposase
MQWWRAYKNVGLREPVTDQSPPRATVTPQVFLTANGITLDFSRPGKPTDNAFVESFHATVRLECLGRHWFLDLDDAREKVEE